MTIDIKIIEQAALAYLHTAEDDEEWPSVKSDFANLAGEPRVILELVAAVRAAESLPSAEEIDALVRLVKDLTGYIKLQSGEKPDPVRDDLILQARQLLGLILA